MGIGQSNGVVAVGVGPSARVGPSSVAVRCVQDRPPERLRIDNESTPSGVLACGGTQIEHASTPDQQQISPGSTPERPCGMLLNERSGMRAVQTYGPTRQIDGQPRESAFGSDILSVGSNATKQWQNTRKSAGRPRNKTMGKQTCSFGNRRCMGHARSVNLTPNEARAPRIPRISCVPVSVARMTLSSTLWGIVARNQPICSRARSTSAGFRPHLARLRPHSTEIRPESTEMTRIRPTCFDVDSVWPEPDPRFSRLDPETTEFRPRPSKSG